MQRVQALISRFRARPAVYRRGISLALWFPALALASILALTAAAHSAPRGVPHVETAPGTPSALTFTDGYNVSDGEKHGPKFILELSDKEVAVVRRAMDKLAAEHEAHPDGIDDYLMGRRKRILEKLDGGGFGVFRGSERLPQVAFSFTLPEEILIGFAVSRDRYRVAPEPEQPALVARIWNWFMGTAIAQSESIESIQNREAISLFDKIAATKHSYPGGNPY